MSILPLWRRAKRYIAGSIDAFFSNVSLLLHMDYNATVNADTYISNTYLWLKFDGANNSTAILDSSPSNQTVTVVNAYITTVQSVSGGTSCAFNGNGYLNASVPGGLGAGSFTLEFWYYKTSASGWIFNSRGTGDQGFDINHDLQTTRNNVVLFSAVGGLSINTWYHVAYVRNGTTFTRYVNGTANGSRTETLNFNSDIMQIGAAPNQNGYLYGYMDNVRVVRGIALYNANFVPPATSDLGVVSFADSSSKNLALSPISGPTISSSKSVFGGHSGLFGGAGASLSTPQSPHLNLGTGDFCIETWIYVLSQSALYSCIVGSGQTSFQSGCVYWMSYGNTGTTYAKKFIFGTFTTNPIVGSVTTPALNQWYHLVVTRLNGVAYMFVNGTLEAFNANSESLDLSVNSMYIGRNGWDGANGYLNAYLDDLRITKGAARHTLSYSVPTAPFTVQNDALYASNSLVLHMEDYNGSTLFADSSVNTVAITPYGGAQISTAKSKFGASSAYFNGSDSYLVIANSSLFDFGSTLTYEGFFNFPQTPTDMAILYKGTYGINESLYFRVTSTGLIVGNGASSISSSGFTWNLNQWYHIALVLQTGGRAIVFIDGQRVASGVITLGNVSANIVIGAGPSNNPYWKLNAYVDEIRLTKGVLRYPTFPVPTRPHPNQ